MLSRSVLCRLSTELCVTRPYDAAHLSQKLGSLRNALNRAVPPSTCLSWCARPFHTSIQYFAARRTNATSKSGRAPRKSASKRAPRKRATSGSKSGARKRATSKAKKRPSKRVPSEKTRARQVAKKKRDDITKLKETALLSSEPKTTSSNAWMVLIAEHVRGEKGDVAARFKDAAAKFRNLSPSEREVGVFVQRDGRACTHRISM